jgi:hypothetical protein
MKDSLPSVHNRQLVMWAQAHLGDWVSVCTIIIIIILAVLLVLQQLK